MTFPPCGEPASPPPDLRRAETVDKGHGRLETRRAASSAEIAPWLEWPGAAQVLRIERTRETRAGTSAEIVYYVTSLPPQEAGPDRLMALARAHWAIENRLHWRRDVSFAEDRCRVRAGARPLASIRNLALAMLKNSGQSIPAAREAYAADCASVLQTVTGRIL